MTFFGMALLMAIGTLVLAMFAVVTAWYARKAFREQSREVAAIEQQVKDGRELAERQADLLKVQSGQLELQQRQFDEDPPPPPRRTSRQPRPSIASRRRAVLHSRRRHRHPPRPARLRARPLLPSARR
jgi:hypothetical protein